MGLVNFAALANLNPLDGTVVIVSDLQYWLDTIQVTQVEEYHIKLNNLPMNMVDWHYVSDDCGIRAYFPSETDALFFRLALVNAKLNKI